MDLQVLVSTKRPVKLLRNLAINRQERCKLQLKDTTEWIRPYKNILTEDRLPQLAITAEKNLQK